MTDPIAHFQSLLARGLGRAVLFLREQSDKRPYRAAILHACIHNLAYDKQCEDHRARYMADIVAASGEPGYYAERFIPLLFTITYDDGSPNQLFMLAGLLAHAGDDTLRRAVYEAWEARLSGDDPMTGANALVAMDGLNGFLFAARRLAPIELPEDDQWEESRLLDELEERMGAEAAEDALKKPAADDPAVGAFLARVRAYREEREVRRNNLSKFVPPSYEELQEIIAAPGNGFIRTSWMKDASAEMVERLANDLLAETDPARLKKYLRLFSFRPFPLSPDRLIELAQNLDEGISRFALRAIANVSHPAVRAQALEWLAAGERPWHAIRLLARNFEEGDWARIEQAIESTDDKDELHWINLGVRDCFEVNPSPDARQSLLRFYEKGYCGMCRCSVVECLQTLGPLPEEIIEECRYDANLELREVAAEER